MDINLKTASAVMNAPSQKLHPEVKQIYGIIKLQISVLEQAVLMDNAKKIYEQLHPESKQVGDDTSPSANRAWSISSIVRCAQRGVLGIELGLWG